MIIYSNRYALHLVANPGISVAFSRGRPAAQASRPGPATSSVVVQSVSKKGLFMHEVLRLAQQQQLELVLRRRGWSIIRPSR